MTRVKVDKDSWYPVYFLIKDSCYGKTINISPKKIKWITKVENEFVKVQDYLETKYKEIK